MVLMQRFQLRGPLTREVSVQGVKGQGEKGADADRYTRWGDHVQAGTP